METALTILAYLASAYVILAIVAAVVMGTIVFKGFGTRFK